MAEQERLYYRSNLRIRLSPFRSGTRRPFTLQSEATVYVPLTRQSANTLIRTSDASNQYHRAHFLDTLLARIPETVPHLGKRLISYSHGDPTGSIKLKFADGTSATCDILIGCDGIKSTVRRIMFQDLADKGQPEMIKFIEPVWTGEVVYRALIPMEHVPLRAGQKHRVLTRSTVVRYDWYILLKHL